MATATNVAVQRGLTQNGQGMYSEQFRVTCTLDPGSLTTGTSEVETVTVPGVVVGDIAVDMSVPNAVAGFIFAGRVTAANTVSITVTNNSGGTVDLASATWKFVVNRLAF